MSHKGKSIFQQFIEANNNLLECYDNIDIEQYKGQPLSKSSGVCLSQKEKVKSLLASNDLTMTKLVTERAHIIRELEKRPRQLVTEHDIRMQH